MIRVTYRVGPDYDKILKSRIIAHSTEAMECELKRLDPGWNGYWMEFSNGEIRDFWTGTRLYGYYEITASNIPCPCNACRKSRAARTA